jgi:hypothetical protein
MEMRKFSGLQMFYSSPDSCTMWGQLKGKEWDNERTGAQLQTKNCIITNGGSMAPNGQFTFQSTTLCRHFSTSEGFKQKIK